MSCTQDCGKFVFCVFAVAAAVSGLLYIGSRDVEWSLQLGVRGRLCVFGLCVGNALCIMLSGAESVWVTGMLVVFAGCLLAASVMDWWEQMVYRFVWWIGGAAGVTLAVLMGLDRRKWYLALLFCAMQELLFAKFYGRADCHAFCVCALVILALGGDFADCVIHMFLVFAAMVFVQLIRRNIAGNGNLKRAVPLLPYITVSFWMWVDFGVGKWYI